MIPACIETPETTARSASTAVFNVRLSNNLLTNSRTRGILVDPPTITTSSTSLGRSSVSASTASMGSNIFLKRSLFTVSNSCRDTVRSYAFPERLCSASFTSAVWLEVRLILAASTAKLNACRSSGSVRALPYNLFISARRYSSSWLLKSWPPRWLLPAIEGYKTRWHWVAIFSLSELRKVIAEKPPTADPWPLQIRFCPVWAQLSEI